MACLKLTMFVPMKVVSLTILMSFILFSIKVGVCMKQTGTCRPICTVSDCITVNQDSVDFKTAEKTCHDRNGELMTFQSEADESILDFLGQELNGNFWIGLRLPDTACSNLSALLRGYEWTSVGMDRNFTPSFNTWKDNVTVCSPHCVSLSNEQKWTERLCSEKTDGFLCKTKPEDACQAQFFKSSKGCKTAPCEHTCKDVRGGYICSCFNGYIPDSKDPSRCKMHCATEKCPAICERSDGCECPDGFIENEGFCEDIDECSMQQCEQNCKNYFGGFFCSCKEGHILKDQVKCSRANGTTKIVPAFVRPPIKKNSPRGSSASARSFIWIWIFITVAVVVLICVVRYYVVKRQKRREQSSNQRSAAPVNNTDC
ncbi:thrombomodulin [Scomber japonicus]|uniref:thrombomodulin n=1 Tax=Scomber japonicus TaxID=13676 RepID=UPI0023061184|nr:thrombomodulin [Scomber japonicus]